MMSEAGNTLAASLSEDDVEKLLTQNGAAPRLAVMEKIASRYNAHQLGPREQKSAEQIFRVLLEDTEIEVRRALAERIKENDFLPRDIVMQMVQDVEDVALPVLRHSQLLTDTDLLNLIHASESETCLCAIAQREAVPEEVSAALAEKSIESVTMQLVENPGVKLAAATYEKIIADFAGNDQVAGSLVRRAGLPATIVAKLVNSISENLAEELKTRYHVLPQVIDADAAIARERATLDLLDWRTPAEEAEQLSHQLYAQGQLGSSLALTALARGNLRFFEMALARLARLPTENARALLNDRGDLGYQAIYAKAGLPDSMMQAVKLMLNVVRENEEAGLVPGTREYANRLAQRMLYFAEGKNIEKLPHLLALAR